MGCLATDSWAAPHKALMPGSGGRTHTGQQGALERCQRPVPLLHSWQGMDGVPASKVRLLLGGPLSKALPACDLLTFPPPVPSSLAW